MCPTTVLQPLSQRVKKLISEQKTNEDNRTLLICLICATWPSKYQLTFHLSDVLQVLDLNFQLLVFLGQSEDGVLGGQKL